MRVYFEKPRTTVGWKGLINDPDMDDSFHIEKGITVARNLLLRIAELGLPAGTEALDPIMPQYLSELITWTAIGARNHRIANPPEMASGPVDAGGIQERHGRRTIGLDQCAPVRTASASFSRHYATGTIGRVSHPRQTCMLTSCCAAAEAGSTTMP